MKEFTGLKFIPKNANPNRRSRIYFCCAQADFDQFFEPISKEILSILKDAVIWYRDPMEEMPSPEELALELGQMQLFVIPITSHFLNDNCKELQVEFRFAVEHNIPVLPLMQQPNLVERFSEKCGDIQYIDKKELEKDATAIPYAKKLEDFLNAVILSEETIQKIRDAFDAYIFLSYRKKDRKFAQDVMRLIHSNEFCHSVAIWYDEFLVPGENFNDAIMDAMNKSKLFTFVVTPNLLEKGNYVERIEYPKAYQSGKSIVPVEAVATNQDEIRQRYVGIPEIISAEDGSRLASVLKDALQEVLKEENSSKEHLFFVGLAYLSGIDVEVNQERAGKLIEKSAEMGLHEAYVQLRKMYAEGIGVVRNRKMEYEWQAKYVELLEKEYADVASDENCCVLVDELIRLSGYTDFVEGVGVLKQAQECIEARLGVSDTQLIKKTICRHAVLFADLEKDITKRNQYMQRMIEMAESVIGEENSAENLLELSSLYKYAYAFDRDNLELLDAAIRIGKMLVELSEDSAGYLCLCLDMQSKIRALEARKNADAVLAAYDELIAVCRKWLSLNEDGSACEKWVRFSLMRNQKALAFGKQDKESYLRSIEEVETYVEEIQGQLSSDKGMEVIIGCYSDLAHWYMDENLSEKVNAVLDKTVALIKKVAAAQPYNANLAMEYGYAIRHLSELGREEDAKDLLADYESYADDFVSSDLVDFSDKVLVYSDLSSVIPEELIFKKIEICEKSIALYKMEIDQYHDLSLADMVWRKSESLSDLYCDLDDYGKAIEVQKNMLDYFEQIGYRKTGIYFAILDLFEETGREEEAQSLREKIESFPEEYQEKSMF